tara:strand:- start:2010 stop:3008 length:999 start_codon:yes stop_codon:yes gene_type:complete
MQWLSALYGIQPLSKLTLLGAGNGYSEVLFWAADHAIENVNLVEANQQPFHQLSSKWQASQPQWQLHNLVMDAGFNKADAFYVANNSAESGLLAPEALTSLWPNITEQESKPCEPFTLAEWASTHWQSAGQWLFIDYFCNASVLAKYVSEFEKVDVLRVRVSKEESVPKDITANTWELALTQAGFRVIFRECERHPHIERWLCFKKLKSESLVHEAELAQAKAELAQVKETLENTHAWSISRKQQALECEKKALMLEESLKVTQEQLAKARQQSTQINLLHELVKQMSQQMAVDFIVQSEQRQQATNALGKHITQLLQPSQMQPQHEEKDNL